MPVATSTEAAVGSRQPFVGAAEAYSAARLERIELHDGRRLIHKHLPAGGDWLTRGTGGAANARRLWESGLLARIASVVDHTVLDVTEVDGHDVVIMRDASDDLLPPKVPVSRGDSRRLLAGLAALHETGRREPVQPLCPAAARYGLFAPRVHADDPRPGANPFAHDIVAAWQIFGELVDPDVVAAVLAVHDDPELLGAPLASFEPTLLHGDAKLENLGLGTFGLVAVDWGELTGFGPPEIDVAWYALMNVWRLGGSPGDVFADYEAAAGRPLDRDALDLVCIGSLAQMGWRLAAFASLAKRAERRAATATELEWWTTRVRDALERVGSV